MSRPKTIQTHVVELLRDGKRRTAKEIAKVLAKRGTGTVAAIMSSLSCPWAREELARERVGREYVYFLAAEKTA
jgi:hypothetical protein